MCTLTEKQRPSWWPKLDENPPFVFHEKLWDAATEAAVDAVIDWLAKWNSNLRVGVILAELRAQLGEGESASARATLERMPTLDDPEISEAMAALEEVDRE